MGITRSSISFLAFTCFSIVAVNSQDVVNNGVVNRVAQANAYFAHRMYNQLKTSSPNIIFSPISMSVALTMVYIGSCETTSEELNSTLGFSFAQLSDQDVVQEYHNLISSISDPGDGYQINLANAQYKQESFPVHDNYTRDVIEYFNAESKIVDFSESEETLELINGWIRNTTQGKLNTILTVVDPTAVMILLNAVYFKGDWLNMFDNDNTEERTFFNENGITKNVQMMCEDLEANYSRSHSIGASILELPYKRSTFSMMLVLPDEDTSLTSLEQKVTPEFLLQVSHDLTLRSVKVMIPKMKLESEYDMISHLRELGITELFTDSACLTGISSVPLGISQIMHKATIEVSEEGCEASAGTAVQFYGRSYLHHHHPVFIANRPFLYFVRHNPTNTILFMGRFAEV